MSQIIRTKGALSYLMVVFLNAFLDLGHKITIQNTILKVYDGANWQMIKAVASISAGLPANPVDGQLHYNKSTNKLVIYDLATTAWINIGP